MQRLAAHATLKQAVLNWWAARRAIVYIVDFRMHDKTCVQSSRK